MPFPGLKNLFSGGASKFVDSVKGVISEFHLSPEDKLKAEHELVKLANEHEQKMAEVFTKQLEAELKDMADSRNREVQIATSEKAPLINKIITPILALFIVISTIVIWALILFRNYEPKTNEAMIIGSLTTLCAGVISYYFGSSSSSKANGDALREIVKKQ